MTEIQNPKQLVFDVIWVLDIVIWNLFVIWCLYVDISGLSGLGSLASTPPQQKNREVPVAIPLNNVPNTLPVCQVLSVFYLNHQPPFNPILTFPPKTETR